MHFIIHTIKKGISFFQARPKLHPEPLLEMLSSKNYIGQSLVWDWGHSNRGICCISSNIGRSRTQRQESVWAEN